MKLHVKERITLLKILPKEASFSTFKILIELKSALSFTEAEHKQFSIQEENGLISWKNSKEKEIAIGEKASEIISQTLLTIDKAEKIDENTYSLYKKFIKEQP
jgi:hypothetical protein